MRQAGLAGISPRRGNGFTRRDPDADLAPDLVRRDFTANVPNRLWVTDLTMIVTGEGPLWLSAIRDAFSRRVVAWETSARADADLVLTTLEYALASREVAPGELIHHADHGCQYTSVKLTTRLVRAGVQVSMGSVGDSFDSALAENTAGTGQDAAQQVLGGQTVVGGHSPDPGAGQFLRIGRYAGVGVHRLVLQRRYSKRGEGDVQPWPARP